MLKYSIFVPAYKADKHIDNFCRNIVLQTAKPDEIIIVDDTKNSKEFEYRVKKKLSNLTNINIYFVKNNKNIKPPRSWNKSIKYFNNHLVFRMDVDDIWTKDHAKKMLNFYKNNVGASIYLQKYQTNFLKKIFYNYDFIFTNQGLHSSCLINLNEFNLKYPIIDLPIDDLKMYIKVRYIYKKKIKFVNFSTCKIQINDNERWSSESNIKLKKKILSSEKKLYFLALKKYLNVKQITFFNFFRIFRYFNIFQCSYIIYRILFFYYKNP